VASASCFTLAFTLCLAALWLYLDPHSVSKHSLKIISVFQHSFHDKSGLAPRRSFNVLSSSTYKIILSLLGQASTYRTNAKGPNRVTTLAPPSWDTNRDGWFIFSSWNCSWLARKVYDTDSASSFRYELPATYQFKPSIFAFDVT